MIPGYNYNVYHGNLTFLESAVIGYGDGWSVAQEKEGWVYVIIKKE